MATENDQTSDTTPPVIDWETAPDQFRDAHKSLTADVKTARNERDALQREIAMLKAGVDAEHPAFSYFNAGYSGELTTDDIKAEWAKITGGGQAPGAPAGGQTPPPPQQETEQERVLRQLQEERGRLTADSVAPGQEPTPDPMDTALATYHKARQEGSNNEQAMRHAFQVIFDSAVAGDGRIVFDSAEAQMRAWKQKRGEDVW